MPNSIEYYGEKLASKHAQERANALVCQITDGFLRGSETRKEKDVRPFEELLTHFLPRADLSTRVKIVKKLAARSDLPRRVLTLFLQDDAAVAEILILHSPVLMPEDIDALIERRHPNLQMALLKRSDLTPRQKQRLIFNIPSLQPQLREEVKPVAEVKPLIIDIPKHAGTEPVAGETPSPIVLPDSSERRGAEPQFVHSMVRAAVLRRQEDLAVQIARGLDLSPIVTKALLKDESGEALIAACHYLGVPEDASIQIATLLYPAVTRSSQQLINLRKTYRAFSPQATQKIAEAWRALPHNAGPRHSPVHAGTTLRRETLATAPQPASEEKSASNH